MSEMERIRKGTRVRVVRDIARDSDENIGKCGKVVDVYKPNTLSAGSAFPGGQWRYSVLLDGDEWPTPFKRRDVEREDLRENNPPSGFKFKLGDKVVVTYSGHRNWDNDWYNKLAVVTEVGDSLTNYPYFVEAVDGSFQTYVWEDELKPAPKPAPPKRMRRIIRKGTRVRVVKDVTTMRGQHIGKCGVVVRVFDPRSIGARSNFPAGPWRYRVLLDGDGWPTLFKRGDLEREYLR